LADQVGATFSLMLDEVVFGLSADRRAWWCRWMAIGFYMDLSKKDGVLLGQEYTIFRKAKSSGIPPRASPSAATRKLSVMPRCAE